MSNSLFDDFPSVSAKQWKQKIQVDIKGADYNKTLLTKTNEGISIKPFYHSDNFKHLTIPITPDSFNICQTIFINNEKKANYLAKNAMKHGANSIRFIAKDSFDIDNLLDGLVHKVSDSDLELYFQLQFLDEKFLSKLTQTINGENIFFNVDIIGNLVKTGNWFYNEKQDHKLLKTILNKANKNVIILGVDASLYQNSGANMIQQVAYAIAHANEYLNHYGKQIGSHVNFNFSVGSNYFFEIAKLRAFRYLWKSLTKEYNLKATANLFVEPTLRNKGLYDYNSNMLRTTTEVMSAILGGANTISNVSYDAIFHKKNEFGERIARNQLVILKDESYIKNADFVDGTYFIEELSYEIADKALKLFKDIEKSGGFVHQLFDGTIQRKIKESADKEQKQFDGGELVLIGTNKYINEKDKMKDTIELYPFLNTKKRETIIQPIIAKRLAENMEQGRLTDEKN